MVLKCFFFKFGFTLHINSLNIECLLKKCITEELPCGSFLQTIIVNRGNFMQKKSRGKPFLFCVNEQICIRFRKFSKRAKVEWNFNFFTFASQCKLFELLNYGEYNHLFIIVTCVLKTTHLSVHRFHSLVFFLASNKVHPQHFFAVEKALITATEFLKQWKYIFE